MPLVPAKCTNCGENLEVDNSLEAAICPACGSPYIVEKAINNYNTYVTNNIQNATFTNQESEEELLNRGITQLEINAQADARETFGKMTKLYPRNYKGWLGLWIIEGRDSHCKEQLKKTYPQDRIEELKDLSIYSDYYVNKLKESIQNTEQIITSLSGEISEALSKNEEFDNNLESEKIRNGAITCAIIFIWIIDIFLFVVGNEDKGGVFFIICIILTSFLCAFKSDKFKKQNRLYADQYLDEKKYLKDCQEVKLENLYSELKKEETAVPVQYYIDLLKK